MVSCSFQDGATRHKYVGIKRNKDTKSGASSSEVTYWWQPYLHKARKLKDCGSYLQAVAARGFDLLKERDVNFNKDSWEQVSLSAWYPLYPQKMDGDRPGARSRACMGIKRLCYGQTLWHMRAQYITCFPVLKSAASGFLCDEPHGPPAFVLMCCQARVLTCHMLQEALEECLLKDVCSLQVIEHLNLSSKEQPQIEPRPDRQAQGSADDGNPQEVDRGQLTPIQDVLPPGNASHVSTGNLTSHKQWNSGAAHCLDEGL
jgi:hypothetical protein